MRQAVELVSIANLVLFVAIAVVCALQWRRERAETSMWAALAFVTIAWVVTVGRIVSDEPTSFAEKAAARVDLALLALFPYLFYRFAVAFEAGRRPLARLLDGLTGSLVVATFALPWVPAEGESWPWWFAIYAFAFVAHWAILLSVVGHRFWRAARTEASVARGRMRLLALGSLLLAGVFVLALFSPAEDSALALAIQVGAALSAVAYLAGFAPPGWLRALWRRPEQQRLQLATSDLMAATTIEDVTARVLPPMASIVGARGVAMYAPDGSEIASHGEIVASEVGDIQRLEYPFGTLVVGTSAFAPFFGAEERRLLGALAALTGLAIDRARLFAQEREAREVLERADELKSEFVALAAHELRTPVSAIYGVSETLAERGPQLAPAQQQELRTTLAAQIRRLRELVEQLLDLSRLDADAVEIAPVRVAVRERLREIVAAAEAAYGLPIEVDAEPELEADIDANALDRIVSNLVVNACRYGRPPIVVRADCRDHVLHVVVEDHGPGVPAEFVPQLFDRFARDARTAETAAGTGLGLAIARSYARAHSGDVSYHDATPHGAAFELTLPAGAPA